LGGPKGGGGQKKRKKRMVTKNTRVIERHPNEPENAMGGQAGE